MIDLNLHFRVTFNSPFPVTGTQNCVIELFLGNQLPDCLIVRLALLVWQNGNLQFLKNIC